jgi:hypothetical protein
VLSKGGYTFITSSNRGIYAALRESDEETVLILINMSKNPISDYSLTFEGARIADGIYDGEPVLGDATLSNLSVASGSTKDFQPQTSLGPFQTILMKLVPAE